MADSDRRAVGLYVVLSRDAYDFIDMVTEEEDVEALKTLYLMLVTPNPDTPKSDLKLNAIGGSIVKGNLEKRGVPLPKVPTPSVDLPAQGSLF